MKNLIAASVALSLALVSCVDGVDSQHVASSSGTGGSPATEPTTGAGGDCSKELFLCHGICVPFGSSVLSDGSLWRDCDKDPANGCEVDAFGDVDNCGGCGVVCDVPNAVQRCVEPGRCESVACLDGFRDCDTRPGNGCEARPSDDAKNCGTCGIVCQASQRQRALCVDGQCQPPTCDDGFSDCNHDQNDGCEIKGPCGGS